MQYIFGILEAYWLTLWSFCGWYFEILSNLISGHCELEYVNWTSKKIAFFLQSFYNFWNCSYDWNLSKRKNPKAGCGHIGGKNTQRFWIWVYDLEVKVSGSIEKTSSWTNSMHDWVDWQNVKTNVSPSCRCCFYATDLQSKTKAIN